MTIALCGCAGIKAVRSALGAGVSRPRCSSPALRWRSRLRDFSPALQGHPSSGHSLRSLKEGVADAETAQWLCWHSGGALCPGSGAVLPPIELEGGALPGNCCKPGVLVVGLRGGLLRKLGAITLRACVLQKVAE